MAREPQIYNQKMHKGSRFLFAFKLMEKATPTSTPTNIDFDPDTQSVAFRARETSSEDNLFDYDTENDPSIFTYDEDTGVFALDIPGSVTSTVPYESLYYTLDFVDSTDIDRWLIGDIQVSEDA